MEDLKIKRYRNSEHGHHMRRMFELREMNPSCFEELPKLGAIAIVGDVPVAAGFLRHVEGGFALLDGLISNPAVPGATRHVAIDAVVSALIEMGSRLGFTRLMANSLDESTLNRSIKHGFRPLDHKVIVLDLREPTT